GPTPGLDVVESMALEVLTASSSPRSSPGPDDDRALNGGPEDDRLDDDTMIGRRIGPYELTARIARGRLGTVYRAARVEESGQEVAVTLIRGGKDADAIVRQFRSEFHIHDALRNHPNIAGLIDAAMTEDGQPYLVSEYVDGPRIDEYCDDRRLAISGR